MIFVILGIIILVVSFAIALVSLIREETKHSQSLVEEKDQKVIPSEEPVLDASLSVPEPTRQPASKDIQSDIAAADWQQFPWHQDRQMPQPAIGLVDIHKESANQPQEKTTKIAGEIPVAKLVRGKLD